MGKVLKWEYGHGTREILHRQFNGTMCSVIVAPRERRITSNVDRFSLKGDIIENSWARHV